MFVSNSLYSCFTRILSTILWKREITGATSRAMAPAPFSSDLFLDISKLRKANEPEETDTAAVNARLEHVAANGPKWWIDGAAVYRAKFEAGETPLPKPIYLEEAKESSLPSREADRTIPIREYMPENGKPSTSVLLHFHGGGFVIGSHDHQDGVLKRWANTCQVTVVSVGYRLAPENPYPAALHDGIDAAEYLLENARSLYGAELNLLAGESAGANLVAAVTFHIIKSRPEVAHQLTGLYFGFGVFDAGLALPSMTTTRRTLIIDRERMERFRDAYLPNTSPEQWRDPAVSPIYEDMQTIVQNLPQKRLPPALFVCGDQDPLLDDTLLMSLKWMATGSQAHVKLYGGMGHGFTMFPLEHGKEATKIIDQFLLDASRAVSGLGTELDSSTNSNKRRRSSDGEVGLAGSG